MRYLFILFLGLSTSAYGGVGFTNISQDEFKDIVQDFAGGWHHTSVSPASALGDIWGFEIGVILGASEAKSIKRLSEETDPNTDFDKLPHAGLLGVLTFPFGITGEVNILPEVKNSDIEFRTGSVAVKWTPTVIWELPVDLAVKAHAASSEITWIQPVAAVPTDIKYKQQVSGILLQVSKKLLIFEPYASIGSIQAKGELSGAPLFDPAYTTGNSASEKVAGTQVMVGFNFNLGFIKLGMEGGQAMGTTTGSLKFSVYF